MRSARWLNVDMTKSGMFHIWCRTVRRAFLMGQDEYSGKDYSHRRNWVKERIQQLAANFAIEVSFTGFLSNHFHLTVQHLPELVETWSDDEVMRRSIRIFPYKFERLGIQDCENPSEARLQELLRDRKLVQEMRKRISNPSWFCRQLNQNIAKRANEEDGCTGHFFEGRFSCKPISTVFQLIICGLYIDLNEYAAGLASSPETSTGSSVYLRLKGRELRQQGDPHAHRFDGFLSPIFAKEPPQGYPPAGRLGNYRVSDKSILEMSLDQYVECLTKLVERIKASRTLRQPKPFKVVSVTANRLLTFAASGPGIGD